MSDALVQNLDDRIFNFLQRSGMYFLTPEAMVSTVLELITIRRWATGAGDFDHIGVLRRMGFADGPAIQFTDRITEDTVEQCRAVAIELGHEPGDRPARAAAWKQHWSECPACQTGSDEKRCANGQAIWDGMPWAWQHLQEREQPHA